MSVLLPLGLLALLAQGPAFAVQGTVSDEATGEPIRDALVELRDLSRRVLSDSAGRFAFVEVPAGRHALRVGRIGYASRTVELILSAGELRIDVRLAASPARLPRLRILDSAAGRGGRLSARGAEDVGAPGSRALNAADVRTHPLLAEPDVLLALGGDGDVGIAPESPTAIHVRGGAGDQSLVLLDGAPVYSPVHASGPFSVLDADALESVALHAGVMPARVGGALSGAIEASSRSPERSRLDARGGMSLTSARLLAEGALPLAERGGFLLGARWGAPALLAGAPDETRLGASSTDVLGKLEVPLAGGTLDALTLATGDHVRFASRVPDAPPDAGVAGPGGRHRFEWGGETRALRWRGRADAPTRLTLRLWQADHEAAISWLGADGPLSVLSERRGAGVHGAVAAELRRHRLHAGLELERHRVRYGVRHSAPDPAPDPAPDDVRPYDLDGRATAASLFAEDGVRLGAGWWVTAGARGTLLSGFPVLFEPRVALAVRPRPAVSLSLGAARAHQPVQSLTNPESPVQGVFGANLPILARTGGAPLARSDQLAAAVELRPRRARLALDLYARRLAGLALPAPATGRPFAVDSLAAGRAQVAGLALAAEWRGDRLTAVSSLGAGRTVTRTDRGRYQPGHASSLALSAGARYQASERTSWRTALAARWGRRATPYEGPLEWEGCSPLDGGCEVAGSPERAAAPMGSVRLPAYLRLDFGARRRWRVPLPGRTATLEGHLTVSNVLGRRNVWTVVSEPGARAARAATTRQVTLLAAGLDWRL